MSRLWGQTVAARNPELERERQRREFEELLIAGFEEIEEKNAARAAAMAAVPLKATPQQKPRGVTELGQWMDKAKLEAENKDKLTSRHWMERGGKMRNEQDIGAIALENGYLFSKDTQLNQDMRKEYEATGTTSKWEEVLADDRKRTKKNRSDAPKEPRKEAKRQPTKWPGSAIDKNKEVGKFANNQWVAHVNRNPNAPGIQHISLVRHYIRETERLLVGHPDPGAIAATMRFRYLVDETRGRNAVTLKDGTYIARIDAKVPWYHNVVNTPDLGTLPEQFRVLYEEILDDLRHRGVDFYTNPVPNPHHLLPSAAFPDDDLEEDWEAYLD